MSKTNCIAVKKEEGIIRRGEATIEWYDNNNKPQYYCRGYNDASTEEPLKTCKNCIDFISGTQIEIDFQKFKESNNGKF